MRKRVNNQTRSNGWKISASNWLERIWKTHGDSGFVFIGTKQIGTGAWMEHSFRLPVQEKEIVSFFDEHSRESFDLYVCLNSFDDARRKKEHARPTPYACVDVDDADLAAFEPAPSMAWQTSPGRTQALWTFNRTLSVDHAEQIARDLAYTFNADKNGWSVTKYLRVPFTYNHKPEYSRPLVRLIDAPSDPFAMALEPPEYMQQTRNKSRRLSKMGRRPSSGTFKNELARGKEHRRRILQKYRFQLTMMPRSLLGHDRLLYPDRSDAIYAMVAGLFEAGATRDEINLAIWNSVYFMDKYSYDRWALETEISRIISKLEVGS